VPHDLRVPLRGACDMAALVEDEVLESVGDISARTELWARIDEIVIQLSCNGSRAGRIGAERGGDPIAQMECVAAEVVDDIARR
jgi:hypothetical protein